MDSATKRVLMGYLQAAMARAGKDATNLARAIGVYPSTLTRPLEADWEGGVSLATLEKIRAHTGLPIPPELQPLSKNISLQPPRRGDGIEREAREAAFHAADRRDLIPVRSAARGGTEQEMFLEDGPVDYVPRPHLLARVKEAYAIYMLGDSMAPKYEAGYTLYVNPFKPPRRDRGVVVYKKNGAVLVKLFKHVTSDAVILEQLNPRTELRIERSDIVHMHLIVHVDEDS
jgi:phage repressor protein C with HTH and peptisase S24 domain